MTTSRVIREIIASAESTKPMDRETLAAWMRSDDPEVLGVVHALLKDKATRAHLISSVDSEALQEFLCRTYTLSFQEDPDGEWAYSRYEAALELVAWFLNSGGYLADLGTDFLCRLRELMSSLYLQGNDEVRQALVNGALEHILEQPGWRPFFAEWSEDPVLAEAYRRALEWSLGPLHSTQAEKADNADT